MNRERGSVVSAGVVGEKASLAALAERANALRRVGVDPVVIMAPHEPPSPCSV
ncbi:hypothetical protein [Streptomyces sp. NPDC058457]|uniref:hypothetical protein n=1 Tax=Streptomyces sp. NPDC058457 TaxID=3346507 RepID=UPI003662ACB3